jgi:hypothetical protein
MKTFKHISIHETDERMNEWMKGSMNPFPGPKQIPKFCNATQRNTTQIDILEFTALFQILVLTTMSTTHSWIIISN